MIEYSLLGNAIYSLLIGAVLGVIDEWNKKVFFVLWLLAVVFVVISIPFTGGVDMVYEGYSLGEFFWRFFWFVIGMFGGKGMYKEAFNNG